MPSHRRRADRTARTTTLIAAVAAVAVLAGACSSGSGGASDRAASEDRPRAVVVDATPAAALLDAAERSGDQSTVETTTRLSIDDEVVGEVRSQGAADGSTARITAELPVVGTVPALVTPEATYLGVPDLPDGAEWLRVSVDELGLAEALGADAVDPPDPQRAFDALRDATDGATEVGPETIDGVDTTRYRFDADVRELVDDAIRSGALPGGLAADADDVEATTATDVWIDDDGLVRRLRFELRSDDTPEGTAAAPDVAFEFAFADYGEPVEVAAPDPATVIDASELWPFDD